MQGQWGANVYDLANQLGQLGVIGLNTLKKFYDGAIFRKQNQVTARFQGQVFMEPELPIPYS